MAKNSIIEKVSNISETLEDFTENRDLYILFIDLCNSTEFKQFCLESDIPDNIWIFRQYTFLSRTAKIVQRYGGTIIKTIGDEIMATFMVDKDPKDILYCCLEAFNIFNELKSYDKGKFIIKLKASVDFGNCYNGSIINTAIFDPIGSCVDRCARISKYSESDAIVFSSIFHDILKEKNPDFNLSNIQECHEELKGLGLVKFYKMK